MSPRTMKHSSSPPSTRRQRRAGFTLIEMLVVIVIIGILAAILFPVISRAKQSALRATCQSNMKQLGLGFLQYVQDNNGRYPGAGAYQTWAGSPTILPQNAGHWMTGGEEGGNPKNYATSDGGLAANSPDSNGNFDYKTGRVAMPERTGLYQYVKSTAVYQCPSTADVEEKHLAYSMNCALAGVKETRISAPVDMILLVDEGQSLNDGYFYAVNQGGATDTLTKDHLGGGNLLFTDGHVRFYGFDQFPLDASPKGLDNKSSLTNVPRFHDKGLGSAKGSASPSPFAAPGSDSCGESNAAAPVVPPGSA